MWKYRGGNRPAFAVEPGPGQESVWDYPRPPALVEDSRRVEVRWCPQGEGAEPVLIADTRNALRVLETASPPTVYIPPSDVRGAVLVRVQGSSYCEWKGAAAYWGLKDAPAHPPVGWSYPQPDPAYGRLHDFLSFYPGRVECYIDSERVRPQPGGFYGGWITDEIVGPVKGEPGTGGW